MHEVGSIVEGKVTGITKFGAFVELDDGTVGMVHISEVSQTFVNDISEHLKEQQQVKVKVMSVNDDGKVALSIKKAMPPMPNNNRMNNNSGGGARPGGFRPQNNNSQDRPPRPNQDRPSRPGGFSKPQGGEKKPSSPPRHPDYVSSLPKGSQNFEDMLSKFMTSADDKTSSLKKAASNRRGGHSKKGPRDYD